MFTILPKNISGLFQQSKSSLFGFKLCCVSLHKYYKGVISVEKSICSLPVQLMESFYNYKLILEDGRLILYNSKTGAISIVKEEQTDMVQRIFENPDSYRDNSLISELVRLGYLVEYGKNEMDEIRAWHDWYTKGKGLLQLILLPAEACNFSCPYCFIYQHRNLNMEDWVYDAIYKYIEKKAEDSKDGLRLELSWYGGEPLLASDRIIEFMNRLEEIKATYPINICSNIITNGYLLTVPLFEKLMDCGIKSFQITMDGDKDSHDKLRVLKGGGATFDTIYNNLKDISRFVGKDKKFSFSIRANFLKNNIKSMEQLLEKFLKDFSEDKRFSIYFRPIYNFETTRDDINTLTSDICTVSEGLHLQTDLIYKAMKADKDSTDLRRISNPLPEPTYSWCTSIRENSHIIGADGAVFSCDTLIVEKDKSVGEITPEGDIVLYNSSKDWKQSIFDEENEVIKDCMKCKLLPVCMGGCRRSRLMSGEKACFWTDEDILKSMREYATL